VEAISEKRLGEPLEQLARSPVDEDAWELLYQRWWPYVLAVNYRMLRGHRDLAEDASQDVFCRLLQYCDFQQVQQPKQFRSYLSVMCRNVVRDRFSRTKQEEQIRTSQFEQLIQREISTGVHLEETVNSREILSKLREHLTEGDRKLLSLMIADESIDQIASNLGISYSYAGVQVHRLRERLRKLLKQQGFIRE
jgi:RNA polymerase sigma factor (sigma-70 family)